MLSRFLSWLRPASPRTAVDDLVDAMVTALDLDPDSWEQKGWDGQSLKRREFTVHQDSYNGNQWNLILPGEYGGIDLTDDQRQRLTSAAVRWLDRKRERSQAKCHLERQERQQKAEHDCAAALQQFIQPK